MTCFINHIKFYLRWQHNIVLYQLVYGFLLPSDALPAERPEDGCDVGHSHIRCEVSFFLFVFRIVIFYWLITWIWKINRLIILSVINTNWFVHIYILTRW